MRLSRRRDALPADDVDVFGFGAKEHSEEDTTSVIMSPLMQLFCCCRYVGAACVA